MGSVCGSPVVADVRVDLRVRYVRSRRRIQDDGFLGTDRVPLSTRHLLFSIQRWVACLQGNFGWSCCALRSPTFVLTRLDDWFRTGYFCVVFVIVAVECGVPATLVPSKV